MAISAVYKEVSVFGDSQTLQANVVKGTRIQPFLRLRFVAETPHFIEDAKGNLQFSATYEQKFHQVIGQFLTGYENYFQNEAVADRDYDALQKIDDFIRALEKTLRDEFEIENEVELDEIRLLGQWPVYREPDEAPLKAKLAEFHSSDESDDYDVFD
jgi:hypothetical protein